MSDDKTLSFHQTENGIVVSRNGDFLNGSDLNKLIEILNTPDLLEVIVERYNDAKN